MNEAERAGRSERPDRMEVAFEPVPKELQGTLLRYSRSLLEYEFRSRAGRGETGEPPCPGGARICEECFGVFVTLRLGETLRGCIGSIRGEEPLPAAIRRRTLDAAFHDRRFPPLREEELSHLSIEHSLLSPLRAVRKPGDIRLGEHGIVFTLGGARSLFLPEVAVQQGWDLDTTLSSLAVKAGLGGDAWRRGEARFQVFRTQHYGECAGAEC